MLGTYLRNIKYKTLVVYCLLAIMTFWIATVPLNVINAYDVLWWLDIPSHIWGGFIFANIAYAILIGNLSSKGMVDYNSNTSDKYYDIKRVSMYIFIFVIIVGIVWEIYEYGMYYYGYAVKWGGWADTVIDVGNDILGATILCYNKFKFTWLK